MLPFPTMGLFGGKQPPLVQVFAGDSGYTQRFLVNPPAGALLMSAVAVGASDGSFYEFEYDCYSSGSGAYAAINPIPAAPVWVFPARKGLSNVQQSASPYSLIASTQTGPINILKAASGQMNNGGNVYDCLGDVKYGGRTTLNGLDVSNSGTVAVAKKKISGAAASGLNGQAEDWYLSFGQDRASVSGGYPGGNGGFPASTTDVVGGRGQSYGGGAGLYVSGVETVTTFDGAPGVVIITWYF